MGSYISIVTHALCANYAKEINGRKMEIKRKASYLNILILLSLIVLQLDFRNLNVNLAKFIL